MPKTAIRQQELSRNDYDVVITDLMMDGTTGYDIRVSVPEQLNIPVLVLTGLGSVDAAVKALKQGAYDHILKPFQFDSFAGARRAIESGNWKSSSGFKISG